MCPGANTPDWQQELLAQITAFQCFSDELRLIFPPTLSAGQRWFLHEEAELKGLSHKSIGEGDQRRIILEKHTSSDEDELEVVVEDLILQTVCIISISLLTFTSKIVLCLKF